MTTTPVALDVSAAPDDPSSYPVGFSFLDDDGRAVITISDDPAEQHGHLAITNTSGDDLLLAAPPSGSVASTDQHHFELIFRPGVLSATSAAQLRVDEQSGWSASGPQRQPDGTVSLYLLSTDGLRFAPAAPLRFRLGAVGADAANSARGTQLELRFRLAFPDGTPLVDTKLAHVDLVNQRGLRNVPLHVGFIGSHTILADGRTPNTLEVRITNSAPSDLVLAGRDDPNPTRFVVSFDVSRPGDLDDLGLGSASALAGMTLEAIDGHLPDDGSDWLVEPGRQLGEGLAWTLTHRGTGPVLGPGQVVRLRLATIVTAAAPGDTNLYLRYENLPGYWDGQFVCTIEKSPIHYDIAGNVGIATVTPQHQLQIGDGAGALGVDPAGPASKDTYIRFGDNTGRALHVARARERAGGPADTGATGVLVTVQDDGRVGIGPDTPVAPLTVQADSADRVEGRQIVVRGRADTRDELAIGYQTASNHGTIQAVTQGVAVRALLLNPAGGSVGVGIAHEPGAALEVNGGIRSPQWRVLSVIGNDSGPLPVTSIPFTTGGGTLLLFVSGSAYLPSPGLVGLQVRVFSAQVGWQWVGTATLTLSQGNVRMPLGATLIASGVPAGDGHQVRIEVFADAPQTRTDGNDLFNVTVLELPF
jgi:hypothetical protein